MDSPSTMKEFFVLHSGLQDRERRFHGSYAWKGVSDRPHQSQDEAHGDGMVCRGGKGPF